MLEEAKNWWSGTNLSVSQPRHSPGVGAWFNLMRRTLGRELKNRRLDAVPESAFEAKAAVKLGERHFREVPQKPTSAA
jgi:hypothetical protein